MRQRHPTNFRIMSPQRLLLKLLVIIISLELSIMFLLPHILPLVPGLNGDFLDSLLLALLSAPFLWFLIARPMRIAALDEISQSYLLLEEQKEFAENLIQNSTLPTFVLDSKHRVISWNLACEGLTGVSAADLIGSTEPWRAFYDHSRPVLADLLIDNNLADLGQLYQSYSRSNVVSDGVRAMAWFPDLNGSDRFIIFSAAPITNKQGELIAVIETLEDITELKRGEEKVRQTLSLLTASLEATADGILVTDLEGRIVTCNRQFVEMWQVPQPLLDSGLEGPLLQHALGLLKQPDVYAVQAMEHYDNPEVVNRHVFEFIDGRIFERYSKPQKVDGKVIGRVRSYRDITEQRNLEAQLRHSQKMESIGTLAGGIAHDFNNILSAIIGYCSLMEMRMTKEDRLRPMVGEILTAANRAAALTQSLLAFSRKQIMDPHVVDVQEIVKGVKQLLQRLLREDIQLLTTLQEEQCTVMADKGQVEQILMNLATNARDAMPGGGKLAISVATIMLDQNFVASHGYGKSGKFALISVSDSGVGMDEATRQRIFEPFFTTKEVGHGTGLGLSMVYGIVKQHNGYINCYSEPGQGTTFRIYLPIISAPADQIAEVVSPDAQGGTETLLLAEDDDQVRTPTRKLLESFGYHVIEAVDGRDALVRFKASGSEIRLVILDVIMPGMNGREVLEEIRKISPDMRVLFTSGYSADVFRQNESGVSDFPFISKPAYPVDFLKTVRLVLDDKYQR